MLDAIRQALEPWLGKPKWKQTEGRVTLTYRFDSEDTPPMPLRLKVEINTREHIAIHGLVHHRFDVQSRWFSGSANLATFSLDELLGTKLRALYQRKKGRDLFDLDLALQHVDVNPEEVVRIFAAYLAHGNDRISRAQFEQNLSEKMADSRFGTDVPPLLAAGRHWALEDALRRVHDGLVALLPGEPWLGGQP